MAYVITSLNNGTVYCIVVRKFSRDNKLYGTES